jgi:hypothetical protein
MSGGLRKTSRKSSWWGIDLTLVRVRDCDDELAGMLEALGAAGPERLPGALPEVGEERERLRRRAGLAGDDPEGHKGSRSSTTRRRPRGRSCRGRGLEPVLDGAKDPAEDPGEAVAAHPGDDGRREAGVADALAEPSSAPI